MFCSGSRWSECFKPRGLTQHQLRFSFVGIHKAAAHAKERKLQEAMLGVKKRYGKNAILKGMNLEEGATAKDQNEKIGGHQA